MWHKSTGSSIGETFWIDPPDYDLCYPYYIKSKVNVDMNDPGIRYYHLWDTNPDDNGNLNRIGKVLSLPLANKYKELKEGEIRRLNKKTLRFNKVGEFKHESPFLFL